jgi:hypothetical protein
MLTLGGITPVRVAVQPALPALARWLFAIAGIGRRRMMGFMVITFIVAFIAFGTSLLRLAHKG